MAGMWLGFRGIEEACHGGLCSDGTITSLCLPLFHSLLLILSLSHTSSWSIPLQASAANDGSVLVFDSLYICTAPVLKCCASGTVPTVAGGTPCQGFLAWHPRGALVVAYESGAVACFQTVAESRSNSGETSRLQVRGLEDEEGRE
jgi:hypothetical protein